MREKKWVVLDIALAKRILNYLEEDLKASGGCDHSVGICACNQVTDMEKLSYKITGKRDLMVNKYPEKKRGF